MDEEARSRLIAEATAQHAREQIKRARANLPLGVVLVALGIAISVAVAAFPVGLVGNLVLGGIGFVLIPSGLAVVVKAAAAIARGNRQLRELAPPAARVISSS